jgi:MoaA/NifB/PqqE/SkfB family radical SAM enzyme
MFCGGCSTAFKSITLQTNGLLLKKLCDDTNASPVTDISASIDGLKDSNNHIRGIRGYFDLAMDGIKSLRNKKVSIAITLNRISAGELSDLADVARGLGAGIDLNILSRSLFFLKDADLASMWPERKDVLEIAKFVRERVRRPRYEVNYITKYYNKEKFAEPPRVLGYLQAFVLSNGDVLSGCYPLKPVGHILRYSLANILASEEYSRRSRAMVRRECPGCTSALKAPWR